MHWKAAFLETSQLKLLIRKGEESWRTPPLLHAETLKTQLFEQEQPILPYTFNPWLFFRVPGKIINLYSLQDVPLSTGRHAWRHTGFLSAPICLLIRAFNSYWMLSNPHKQTVCYMYCADTEAMACHSAKCDKTKIFTYFLLSSSPQILHTTVIWICCSFHFGLTVCIAP